LCTKWPIFASAGHFRPLGFFWLKYMKLRNKRFNAPKIGGQISPLEKSFQSQELALFGYHESILIEFITQSLYK
jgi:hypothetical protein